MKNVTTREGFGKLRGEAILSVNGMIEQAGITPAVLSQHHTYISIYGTSCLLPAYAFHIESVSYAVSSDFCLKFRAMAIHCLVFQETEHTRDLPLVTGLALHAFSLAGCRGLSSLSHSLSITAKEQRWSRRTKKKASQKTDWLSC